MIFIHGYFPDLQRRRFAPEDREPKRRIELLGRGLLIAHCEDDLFEPNECSRSPQYFRHQAPRDSLATIFSLYKNSPDSALMPFLEARVAPETGGSHEGAAGKGAQHEVFIARGRQASAEDFQGCLAMFLRG